MSSAKIDSAESTEILTSKPFRTLNELYSNIYNLIPWGDIKELEKTTSYVYSGKDINDVTKPLIKYQKNEKPKTLVCHDMRGGYIEDRFINGSEAYNSYVFYHWSVVDTFVYFSHNFITIPPYGWINAAHIHGVKILGTIITEWNAGAGIWDEIFVSDYEIERFANALITVTKFYKFDGWLINVENVIKKTDIDKLKYFVQYLTDNIHRQIENSEIIWYDSVTCEGKLSWQNQLNDSNKCFFDLCDGIFLNYNWTDSGLAASCDKAKAQNRVKDIYVGLDVWGRGCPGGGGFNSDYALRKIREHDMSVAIFGAGWTHENFGAQSFEDIENVFWAQLFPYLYIHVPLYDNKIFGTSFCRGAGSNNYHLGQESDNAQDLSGKSKPFYNLSLQCFQLSVPSPDLVFLTQEEKTAAKNAEILSNSPENRTEAINARDLFLNSRTDSNRGLREYETKSSIVRVQEKTVVFQHKPNRIELNHFQFYHNYAFNGGGCLELVTRNPELHHRLFMIEVTFEDGIQVSLVYRMDMHIPEHSEPILVVGNGKDLQLIRKYSTTELQYPWRRNLYLTNYNTVTEIGVAAAKEGTIILGEVIVEQKQR